MFVHVPYFSTLKPGSYTHKGLNMHQVVQHNERNKHLGPFKHQVPKLLNLINVKMVPYIKENYVILNISLNVYTLLSDVATVNRLQHSYHVRCLPTGCTYRIASNNGWSHINAWSRLVAGVKSCWKEINAWAII